MYYEFYIDQFAAEQLLSQYLLLALCARILGRQVSGRRLALGSVLGTAMMVLAVCTGRTLFYPAALCFAAFGAFGRYSGNLRQDIRKAFGDILALLGVTIAFGGALGALTELFGLPVLMGCFISTWLVRFITERRREYRELSGRVVTVKLVCRGKKECSGKTQGANVEQIRTVRALIDTGNELREPLTGLPVSIVQAKEAERLLGGDWEANHGVFLIPYRSLGTEKAWLRGVKLEQIRIVSQHGEKIVTNPVIALYDGKLSTHGRYEMILHPEHAMTESEAAMGGMG